MKVKVSFTTAETSKIDLSGQPSPLTSLIVSGEKTKTTFKSVRKLPLISRLLIKSGFSNKISINYP